MTLSTKRKERMRRIIRVLMVFLAVLLLFVAVGIPLINNGVALGIENDLKDLPLPANTQLVESYSLAGRLAGNGNGMQYFGVILLQTELTEEELMQHYASYRTGLFDHIVVQQTGQRVEQVEHAEVVFSTQMSDEGFYIVYTWGGVPDWAADWLNLDVRGH